MIQENKHSTYKEILIYQIEVVYLNQVKPEVKKPLTTRITKTKPSSLFSFVTL